MLSEAPQLRSMEYGPLWNSGRLPPARILVFPAGTSSAGGTAARVSAMPFATNVANLVTSSKARSTERSVLRLLAPSSKSALLRLHLIIAVMRLLQWIVMRILTRLLNPRQTTKSRFSKSWFFIDSVDTLPILLEKFYTQKRLF